MIHDGRRLYYLILLFQLIHIKSVTGQLSPFTYYVENGDSSETTSSFDYGEALFTIPWRVGNTKPYTAQLFQMDCESPIDTSIATLSTSAVTPYNATINEFVTTVDMDVGEFDSSIYTITNATLGQGVIHFCLRVDMLEPDLDMDGNGEGNESVSYREVVVKLNLLLQTGFTLDGVSLANVTLADLSTEVPKPDDGPVNLPESQIGICKCSLSNDDCDTSPEANDVRPNEIVLICIKLGDDVFGGIKFDEMDTLRISQGEVVYEPLSNGNSDPNVIILFPSSEDLFKLGVRIPSVFFNGGDSIVVSGIILFTFGRRNRFLKISSTINNNNDIPEVQRMVQDVDNDDFNFELVLNPVDGTLTFASIRHTIASSSVMATIILMALSFLVVLES